MNGEQQSCGGAQMAPAVDFMAKGVTAVDAIFRMHAQMG
jgi:hypothetical protein